VGELEEIIAEALDEAHRTRIFGDRPAPPLVMYRQAGYIPKKIDPSTLAFLCQEELDVRVHPEGVQLKGRWYGGEYLRLFEGEWLHVRWDSGAPEHAYGYIKDRTILLEPMPLAGWGTPGPALELAKHDTKVIRAYLARVRAFLRGVELDESITDPHGAYARVARRKEEESRAADLAAVKAENPRLLAAAQRAKEQETLRLAAPKKAQGLPPLPDPDEIREWTQMVLRAQGCNGLDDTADGQLRLLIENIAHVLREAKPGALLDLSSVKGMPALLQRLHHPQTQAALRRSENCGAVCLLIDLGLLPEDFGIEGEPGGDVAAAPLPPLQDDHKSPTRYEALKARVDAARRSANAGRKHRGLDADDRTDQEIAEDVLDEDELETLMGGAEADGSDGE
jgi:hypothetical protein